MEMTQPQPQVTVLVTGYSPRHGNMPGDRTRPCGSVTLVRSGDRRILVDTGREDDLLLAGLAAAGARPDEIDVVVLTHTHRDHTGCLALLPRAQVLAGERELEDAKLRLAASEQRGDQELLARAIAAPKTIAPGVETFPTPGHTPGSLSVLVWTAGVTFAICGDAVGDEAGFAASRPSENSADAEMERASMQRLAEIADVIVPGHGVPFAVGKGSVPAGLVVQRGSQPRV